MSNFQREECSIIMGCIESSIFHLGTQSNLENWPQLPDEVWIKIFGYLDQKTIHFVVSFVSKRWLTIVRNDIGLSGHLKLSEEIIKKRFHLDVPKIIFDDDNISDEHRKFWRYLSAWPKIQKITFKSAKDEEDVATYLTLFPSLKAFQEKYVLQLPYLRELEIACYFTIKQYDFMAAYGLIYTLEDQSQRCSKLEIDYTNYNNPNVLIKGLEFIAYTFKKIDSLSVNLYMGHMFRGQNFTKACQAFLSLPVESIRCMELHLGNSGPHHYINFILKSCPKVGKIVLHCAGYTISEYLMSIIEQIQVRHLVILDLKYGISNKMFRLNENIKILILERCNLEAQHLLQIGSSLNHLKMLYIHKVEVNPKDILEFMEAASNLKNLHISVVKLNKVFKVRNMENFEDTIQHMVSMCDYFQENMLSLIHTEFSKQSFIRMNFLIVKDSEKVLPAVVEWGYQLVKNKNEKARIVQDVDHCSSCGSVFKTSEDLINHVSRN